MSFNWPEIKSRVFLQVSQLKFLLCCSDISFPSLFSHYLSQDVSTPCWIASENLEFSKAQLWCFGRNFLWLKLAKALHDNPTILAQYLEMKFYLFCSFFLLSLAWGFNANGLSTNKKAHSCSTFFVSSRDVLIKVYQQILLLAKRWPSAALHIALQQQK